MSDTVVIIPAAGASTRMGFNKLFAELCGVPVLVHTIRRISSSDEITSIILAVPPGAEPVIQRDIVTAFQLDSVSAIVAGGATRLESVWNAFQAIPSPGELVAVHDAARPFIASDVIRRALAAARESGAALVATPIVPTIKQVDASLRVTATCDRSLLWAAATPQVFRHSLFLDAAEHFWASNRSPAEITDDAQLFELAGYPVTIVPGNPENIKLTTLFDWQIARAFAEQWLHA